MSIESTRNRSDNRKDFLICCDTTGCHATLDARDRTFQQAVIFLKAKGWRITKVYSQWRHYCPTCGDLRIKNAAAFAERTNAKPGEKS